MIKMTTQEAKSKVTQDLAKIAFWFENTLGFPHDLFYDKIESFSLPEAARFILNFKKEHPNQI